MFDYIENKISEAWKGFWAWCKNSGTIVLARIFALSGTATAFIGSMDWSPLWSFLGTGTLFTKQQVISIGVSILGAGIVSEIVRRSRTKEVNNSLIPDDVTVKKIKK